MGNIAVGFQFQSTLAVREMLYPDLHKCKVSHQAPEKDKLDSKEWTEGGLGWYGGRNGLKIRNCTGFKTHSFPIAYCSIKLGSVDLPSSSLPERLPFTILALYKETGKGMTNSKEVTIYSGYIITAGSVLKALPHNQGVWDSPCPRDKSFSSIFALEFPRI